MYKMLHQSTVKNIPKGNYKICMKKYEKKKNVKTLSVENNY